MNRAPIVAVAPLLLVACALGCGSVVIPAGAGGTGAMGTTSAITASSSSVGGSGGAASSSTGETGGSDGGGLSCVPVDDKNPCTEDTCYKELAIHPPRPNGTACDDGEMCTQTDTCQAGACVGGNPILCTGGATCVAGACVGPGCAGIFGVPKPAIWSGSGVPRFVTTADLNGDGKLDLISANEPSSVATRLGVGDGTFAAPVVYLAGEEPSSVAAVDLDGDGRLDLVVANTVNESVGVLVNLGNATFAPMVIYGVVVTPYSMVTADLNGDGKLDVAIAGYNDFTSGVNVLLNLGSGTFAPVAKHTEINHPSSLAVADVNGDGALDLVAVSKDNGTLSVLLNLGNGTFAAAKIIPTGLTPELVAAADLNGDGAPDLLVATGPVGDEKVGVLLNAGDGTFAMGASYPENLHPISALITADFNGDGVPDVAATNLLGHSVSVLVNQGDGTFGPAIEHAAGVNPVSVTAADLNGDGALDLVVADAGLGKLTVWLNDCLP